ncbi:unnamed protein product [Heterobilharzia americana]|nr:unnamed protein product [Heterobilharzia americana]
MVRQKMNQCNDEQREEELSTMYKTLDKEVKKSARKDKRHFYETLAGEAEQAAGKRDLTTLYQITRLLSGKRSMQTKPIKDDDENLIRKGEKQRKQYRQTTSRSS